MGVVVSETTIETRMAAERVTANSRNSRPMMPPISSIGMNTAISEMLMESTVKPIPRHPAGPPHGRHPVFQVPRDVFHDDDRVVYHEAAGDGERHQRQIVERVSRTGTSLAHVPMSETGTATAGNERRVDVAQEQRRPRERPASRKSSASARYRLTEARMVSVRSTIVTRCCPRGIVAWSDGMAPLHGVHGFNDVGAGLPED